MSDLVDKLEEEKKAMINDPFYDPIAEGLDRAIAIVRQHAAAPAPVSLIDCAMALQGNDRIKLGADLQAIAKTVLDAAGTAYAD